MGLPRLRNSLSGWHKGAAWFTLPLLLLSPLTGLCIAFGLTFQSAPPPAAKTALRLPEAVRLVAQSHDLSHLSMIANRGGRMMARIYENGELRAYSFTADGVDAAAAQLAAAAARRQLVDADLGLAQRARLDRAHRPAVTGVVLWARRKLRRRPTNSAVSRNAAAAGPAS